MEKQELISIEKFIAGCNDLLEGKYFSLEPKIEAILRAIAESEPIYSLIGDCMQSYEHEVEFEKVFVFDEKTNKGRIDLPSEEYKTISLVFCVLTDISEGRIMINQFINSYFLDKSLNTGFTNFGKKLIRPFRDLIATAFNVSPEFTYKDIDETIYEEPEVEEVEDEEEVEEENLDSNVEFNQQEVAEFNELFIKVETVCDQMLSSLNFERKRKSEHDDAEFVVNAVISACKEQNLELLNGLVIGLNYISKKVRCIRYGLEEINSLIFDFYNEDSNDPNSNIEEDFFEDNEVEPEYEEYEEEEEIEDEFDEELEEDDYEYESEN